MLKPLLLSKGQLMLQSIDFVARPIPGIFQKITKSRAFRSRRIEFISPGLFDIIGLANQTSLRIDSSKGVSFLTSCLSGPQAQTKTWNGRITYPAFSQFWRNHTIHILLGQSKSVWHCLI